MRNEDAEYPVRVTVAFPAGRRRYRCLECGRAIAEGERHCHVHGLWAGGVGWASFRVCRRCVAMRAWAETKGVEAALGDLVEELEGADLLGLAGALADGDWVDEWFGRAML